MKKVLIKGGYVYEDRGIERLKKRIKKKKKNNKK